MIVRMGPAAGNPEHGPGEVEWLRDGEEGVVAIR